MAQRLEDLEVWQLADGFRFRVHALLATGEAARDVRFRDQLRDAAGSITRNIAEGFGRYRHREFAHFLDIARGSTFEALDLLRDGVARGHWSSGDVADLQSAGNRIIGGLTALVTYLKSNPAPLGSPERRRKRQG